MIFDAHLDLAMNIDRGRDVTRPAARQPIRENEVATVGLPDLRAGGVRHVCATVFCQPRSARFDGYTTPREAWQQACVQLDSYDRLLAAGELGTDDGGAIRVTLLVEGAECVRSIDDVAVLHARGVRVLGLAWQATRYAGGTATPGPLTHAGLELVGELDRLGIVHDASHLAERSFWGLMDATDRMVIASHSNCRAIIGADPNERHLSDRMIRAIARRGGVIGINFLDRFLLPHAQYQKRPATLRDVARHVRHVCDVCGSPRHVGIGTDMDGGLGRLQLPLEIDTAADLPKLSDALADAGFDQHAIGDILWGNWRRVLVGSDGATPTIAP